MRFSLRRPAATLALGAAVALVAAIAATPSVASAATPDGGIQGVDVSAAVDWATAPSGTQFAYIEATDNARVNSNFYANWAGAASAGIAHGAYHFAVPSKTASNGATQAAFFYANGAGITTASPETLPPVLDVEYDPNAGTSDPTGCWNLQPAQTVAWIKSFVTEFVALSGRTPVIYTSSSYWTHCIGGASDFKNYPLWVADLNGTSSPTLGFGGWTSYKFWQYQQPSGSFDLDSFHGTLAQLEALGSPRVAGPDRFATGVAASQSFPKGTGTVYVASGANFPDALSAGAAAGKAGGPVLLVNQNAVSTGVAQALKYLAPSKLVIVGGPSAVSNAVQTTLKNDAPTATVTREYGADRFATSADIATSSFASGVANAYVAVGTSWPDALSGSALAASAKGSGPMLLVTTGAIPSSVTSALNTLKPKHITVFGGTAAVNASVASALAKYAPVTRIAGADRFATSADIAAQLKSVSGTSGAPVYVASGVTFPDALVGAPMAALTSSPVLLVMPSSVPATVSKEISALAPSSYAIMGGPASVGSAVQSTMSSLVK